MKIHIGRTIIAVAVAFMLCCTFAYAQDQQDPPDFVQMAEEMADKWQELLDLNDYQVFYIDSTLKHDYVAMNEEMMKLKAQRVLNSSLFYDVQDKWMEITDSSFRKILDDKQWAAYLKNGALKQQRERAKRKEKAEKANMELKKNNVNE